jgi:cytoskeleton protein RodZ
MTMTATLDEDLNQNILPGATLASLREQKGMSIEYVAGKLHLRTNLIEHLECDAYEHMPDTVFIKGYIRAYAKLLGIDANPLVQAFNRVERKDIRPERAIWQNKREQPVGEFLIKWTSILIIIVGVVAIGMWWQGNTEAVEDADANVSHLESAPSINKSEPQEAPEALKSELPIMNTVLPSNLPFSPLEPVRE